MHRVSSLQKAARECRRLANEVAEPVRMALLSLANEYETKAKRIIEALKH
jgi:hypothetical protein